MAIPTTNQITTRALRLLAEHDSLKLKQFYVVLAKYFKLTQEELDQESEGSSDNIFYYRIRWTLSNLSRSKLVAKPERARYQISDKGRELLEKPDPDGEVLKYIASKLQKRAILRKAKKEGAEYRAGIPDAQEEVARSELPPEEELTQAFSRIKETACDEILEMILSKSPREFENLVVELFSRMGYGEKVSGGAEVTPFSRDGGIDGIIKEDVLGLGRIYIQAKRYRRENSVPERDVKEFAGTLQGRQAGKGVFITTSSYAKGARKYADSLNTTSIVLIDGTQLAKYIYDYGLGMQVRKTIEIKKFDDDYWDSMEDDNQDNAL